MSLFASWPPRAPELALCGTTTRVSRSSAASRVLSASTALARASLFGAFVVLSSTGCLITSTPDFGSPQQTPPLLVAGSAHPSLTETLTIVPNNADVADPIFSASVLSEDDGEPVQIELLIDYGDPSKNNPFQHQQGGTQHVDPGTLSEGPRPTGDIRLDHSLLTVPPARVPIVPMPICHTVTMIATHNFVNGGGCPLCITDSSTLTWLYVACPESDGRSCPPFSLDQAHVWAARPELVRGLSDGIRRRGDVPVPTRDRCGDVT